MEKGNFVFTMAGYTFSDKGTSEMQAAEGWESLQYRSRGKKTTLSTYVNILS